MRKAVLRALGQAIFNTRCEEALILTGPGRDGKDELMEMLHRIFPHLVSFSVGRFTTSATTHIAVMRIERNGDPRVDVHE
eukprot:1584431-Pleurochrysis_carterae.AAC.1